ncbi:MAG: hypothetical protein ACXQS8_05295, partial [Candidatus Helarchaeales archaeon]
KKIPRVILNSNEVDGIILYGIWSSDSLRYWLDSAPEDLKKQLMSGEAFEMFTKMLEGGAKSLKRFSDKFKKPIIGSSPFCRTIHPLIDYCQDHGLPVYQFEESVKPLVLMVKYAEWLREQEKQV